MATNNFNSDPTNDSFEPLMSYFDSQGVNRLESANISSYGFDGFIPTVIQNRTASGILPGMAISLTGSSTGQNFYKVLSNNVGDRAFTASPSNEIVIEYLDNDQLVQVLSASVNDIFSVSYENWDGKDLGSTGWYLGNSGNAIFSNVAVRGRIEATEGVIEGGLSLGGSLTASTNVGQIILSSSGIFGSTASGSFNLNTISGQINITGQINAKSGEISYLTVGDNNFPILNIVGASWVNTEGFSGAIILSVYQYAYNPDIPYFPNSGFQYPSTEAHLVQRYMAAGDYFQLSGVSASGIGYNNSASLSQSALNNYLNGQYKVLTASLAQINYSSSAVFDRYFCTRVQPFEMSMPNLDFSNVTASSGSYTNGFLFFGEYNVKNGSAITRIDGVTFSSIKPGTTWNTYIPDFIDLSGRLRLANGLIRNTLTTASQTTNGLYVRGSIQNIRPVFNITASAVLISSNNPKDPTEINLETSRSNFIYEITPVGGSCVVTIFNSSFPIGEEFTVINTGTSGNIYFTMDPTSASINAVKNITVLSGQWNQATLRKRQDFSWLLSLDK